jgi:hypothetical protein
MISQDEKLTSEEIYIICGEELTNQYDLTNMYSILDESLVIPSCPDCKLHRIKKNKHLFYHSKLTRCRKCSKAYSKQYTKNKNREANMLKCEEYTLIGAKC